MQLLQILQQPYAPIIMPLLGVMFFRPPTYGLHGHIKSMKADISPKFRKQFGYPQWYLMFDKHGNNTYGEKNRFVQKEDELAQKIVMISSTIENTYQQDEKSNEYWLQKRETTTAFRKGKSDIYVVQYFFDSKNRYCFIRYPAKTGMMTQYSFIEINEYFEKMQIHDLLSKCLIVIQFENKFGQIKTIEWQSLKENFVFQSQTFEYKNGQLANSTLRKRQGEIMGYQSFTRYDAHSNVILHTTAFPFLDLEDRFLNPDYTTEYHYEYDKNGNWITQYERHVQTDALTLIQKREITYF